MMSAPSAISNFERFLGRKKMLGAIEMRAKCDAFVRDFAQLAEAENLEAAGIGENRARPGHEFVQPAHRANQFVARTKIKMIGIREKYLHAEIFEILLRLPFHRGRCSHGHERRRVNHAVRRRQAAQVARRWDRSPEFRIRKPIRESVSGTRRCQCREAKASGQFWPNRARTGPELRDCVGKIFCSEASVNLCYLYFIRSQTNVRVTGVPSAVVVLNLIVSLSPEIVKFRLMSFPTSPGNSALSR